jgi:drug/metabolite transporter (DMT)-like permease
VVGWLSTLVCKSRQLLMATLEPVVATTLGWIIFSERLDLQQIIGGILVAGSVILIQLPRD